ncbi:MAG: hypothetical protein PHZ00_05785 [Candidatus Peribacteraceae bacterium]|nr:hypothetical protein [Candidatus Peribacteraceae bacterium]
MHRSLFFIGLILLPLGASAATNTYPEVRSEWVRQVLQKADVGISNAAALASSSSSSSPPSPSPSPSPCKFEQLENIAGQNVSLVRSWIQSTIHLADEADLLRERTVCFQSDRMFLQSKLEEVMGKMTAATEVCDSSQNVMLEETMRFLTRAYLSFLKGALDPTYEDDLLRQRYHFDTQDPDPAASLCPFSTDYGPHSIGYLKPPPGAPADDPVAGFKSYGCDRSVMLALPSSLIGETAPMMQFMQQTDAIAGPMFNDIRNALMNLQDLASALSGGSATPGGSLSLPSPPPHRSVSGCLKPTVPDNADPSFAKDIESLLAAFPGYFDPKQQDPHNGLSPPPERALPTGVLFLPSFDSFLSASNPLILLRRFMVKEVDTGVRRPLPEYLFAEETGDMIPMHLLGEVDAPGILQRIAGNSQLMIGALEAGSRDALERMEDLSLPLKAAVLSLTDVVEHDFPETYIPDFAFFAARSCVDGPCQKTLETVINRSLNPYCHPYLSGRYREEDSMKKCFCDPTIKSSWGEFDQYCSETYKRAEYEARPEALIPACFGE